MTAMYHRVQEAAPLTDYRLLLTFNNGDQRIFDMKPYLEKGVFAALTDPALFSSVRVVYDTIAWSNGADLCPEVLYSESIAAEPDRTAR